VPSPCTDTNTDTDTDTDTGTLTLPPSSSALFLCDKLSAALRTGVDEQRKRVHTSKEEGPVESKSKRVESSPSHRKASQLELQVSNNSRSAIQAASLDAEKVAKDAFAP
jgi:hypothetical protein